MPLIPQIVPTPGADSLIAWHVVLQTRGGIGFGPGPAWFTSQFSHRSLRPTTCHLAQPSNAAEQQQCQWQADQQAQAALWPPNLLGGDMAAHTAGHSRVLSDCQLQHGRVHRVSTYGAKSSKYWIEQVAVSCATIPPIRQVNQGGELRRYEARRQSNVWNVCHGIIMATTSKHLPSFMFAWIGTHLSRSQTHSGAYQTTHVSYVCAAGMFVC